MKDSIDAWDSWNYEDGQEIRVVCYTNAARARLLLNGREVGAMTPFNDESGIIGWDVPYQAGTLKAEGFDVSGKKVSEYEIRTVSRPAALRAKADRSETDAGGVIHVEVEILDDKGNIVVFGDNEITCTVEGPGSLLGLESADNTDMGDWTDNVQRACRGRLLAYIQTESQPGRIKVKFSSPSLEGTEVEILTHQ